VRYGHQKFALGMCIFPVTPLTDVTFAPFCSNTVTVHWAAEDKSTRLFLYSTMYLIMPNNGHLVKNMATQISLPTIILYTAQWAARVREGWNCLSSLASCHENTYLTCTKEVSGLNPGYPYCGFFKQYFKRHMVAQLTEALCYKPEGHGFDSRWCHWNFSFT